MVEICRFGCNRGAVILEILRRGACSDIYLPQVSEETVLTDPAGIHLGAGPYLLIYSKALPGGEAGENMPLPWPQPLKVSKI